jgi:hypothetical protein
LGHRSSDKSLKKYLESIPRKHLVGSLYKDSYKCNIAHNTRSFVALNMRPERWGSPLAKEMYQGEQACDKRQQQQQQNIIITIIIIITVLPVGLYGRETWPLTFREEHRLRYSRIECLGRYLG